jgi:hypothetical protein
MSTTVSLAATPPAHDRGYDDPQSVALDPTTLDLRHREVQSSLQLSRLGMADVRAYR